MTPDLSYVYGGKGRNKSAKMIIDWMSKSTIKMVLNEQEEEASATWHDAYRQCRKKG